MKFTVSLDDLPHNSGGPMDRPLVAPLSPSICQRTTAQRLFLRPSVVPIEVKGTLGGQRSECGGH